MKPHPRIRKTIKWGGPVVTVLLVVVWIGSGWVELDAGFFGVPWSISHGCLVRSELVAFSARPTATDLELTWARYLIPKFTDAMPHRPGVCLMPFSGTVLGSMKILALPLWPLIVMAGCPTGVIWWRDARARRAGLNLCPKCNYDRAGIATDAVCPECGHGAADAKA